MDRDRLRGALFVVGVCCAFMAMHTAKTALGVAVGATLLAANLVLRTRRDS